jgi:AcrR family transcriptional regulator
MQDPEPLPLRERKKLKARAAILRAARRLIGERGYEQATMRDIATDAELSYQTLYNYFPTKALILQEILTDQVQHVAAEIEDILQSYEGGLLEALDAVNRIRFDLIAHEDRDLWRIVTADLIHHTEEADAVYRLIDQEAHSALEALLRQAQAGAELTDGVEVPLLADTLFCLFQQHLSRFLFSDHSGGTDALDAALQTLARQTRLLITPYLTPYLRPIGKLT